MGDASGADKTGKADKTHGSAGAASMPSLPSLYEAIGGERPVRAVLQALYDRLFDDAMIGFLFAGKSKAHIVEQQLAFTCQFLGGPQVYEGLPLPKAHAGLPLLPGHFDRRHRLLEQVLEAQGVPVEVKRVWLQIDSALRPSVLASAEEAREKTRR
jgi:hemoglobin